MSDGESRNGGRDEPNESDPFAAVRENAEAVEAVAERNGRLGAAARVALALAHDEQPVAADLETAGFPSPEDAPTATPNSGKAE